MFSPIIIIFQSTPNQLSVLHYALEILPEVGLPLPPAGGGAMVVQCGISRIRAVSSSTRNYSIIDLSEQSVREGVDHSFIVPPDLVC